VGEKSLIRILYRRQTHTRELWMIERLHPCHITNGTALEMILVVFLVKFE